MQSVTLPTFSNETDYHVLPATVLSDEPIDAEDTSNLRADASTDGVCFVHICRTLQDGSLLARAAAHPDLLPEQGYTVILNRDDIQA